VHAPDEQPRDARREHEQDHAAPLELGPARFAAGRLGRQHDEPRVSGRCDQTAPFLVRSRSFAASTLADGGRVARADRAGLCRRLRATPSASRSLVAACPVGAGSQHPADSLIAPSGPMLAPEAAGSETGGAKFQWGGVILLVLATGISGLLVRSVHEVPGLLIAYGRYSRPGWGRATSSITARA